MGSIRPTHVLHDDMCERYILHMLTPGALAHYKQVYDCNTSYCFFSMCAVIFCGWNLFGHQVFLPAIAVMSSQQIRILQSSNLYWCRNSHTDEGILVWPARHPLLQAAIDKVMKHAHPLWGHDNPSIWLFTDKCGSCFRVALKASSKIGQNALGNWRSVC